MLDLDSRAMFFYMGVGVSPAMTVKMVGPGSQYVIAYHDAAGQRLDAARTYRLHLPAPIPAQDFWSLLVCDPQTRSLLQTDQLYAPLEPWFDKTWRPGEIELVDL